jgi:hypothetical protein
MPAVAALFMDYAGYVGPGDLVSGATAWWGLRAYSLAAVGTKAIRLREDSGNTESDFNTVFGGGLDVASITTFKGAANLFVTKIYDQTGNAYDLAQATAASQPSFTLSGVGSLPTMTFDGTASRLDNSGAIPVIAANGAVTTSHFTNLNATHGSYPQPFGIGFNTPVLVGINIGSASGWNIYWVGGTQTLNSAAFTTGTWDSVSGTFNGASPNVPKIFVNGTLLSTGTGAATASPSGIGSMGLSNGPIVGDSLWSGKIQECGLWLTDASSSVATFSSNQHNYWGV